MKFLLPLLALIGMSWVAAVPAQVFVAREPASVVRSRVMALVNATRAEGRRCGREYFPPAAPLTDAGQLRKAAQRHADDMARRKYFDHRGKDGSQPKDRVKRAGYSPQLIGENIAFAPESAEEVVAGWLASPGHCANIMDARFTETGIAVATGRQRGHIYWVQVFGWPQSTDR